jgi:hypothetical protein
MNNEHEEELSRREMEAFNRLAKEVPPPRYLEERIVASLKQSNLIRAPGTNLSASYKKIGIAVAASLALFALGALAGAWWASAPSKKSATAEFMLVLRSSLEESRARTPDETKRLVKEYGDWAGEIQKSGLLIGGEKLKDEARLLSTVDGSVVISLNQPASENKSIAGYFLILARDYEHAITIAETCPHLKYGGTVEIRQIERF